MIFKKQNNKNERMNTQIEEKNKNKTKKRMDLTWIWRRKAHRKERRVVYWGSLKRGQLNTG
jgi:predicted ATPase